MDNERVELATGRPEGGVRLNWVRDRLPWIVALAALVVYGLSVSRWVRLEGLALAGKVGGWDWMPMFQNPLTHLVTFPVRWLPAGWQGFGLNGVAVVLGALGLGLLARCVSLLPHDRTLEERMRMVGRGEAALMGGRWCWVPVVLAVSWCGLELTYWEHGTVGSGEALDLVIFAYAVRCLLEYRVSREEKWLSRLALVYGLGVTNNYAMVGFFPAFLVALVWIKGWEFFRLRFMGRMVGWGSIGLLMYLWLPLCGIVSGQSPVGWWDYLRAEWGYQRMYLLGYPPYMTLLLSLATVVPVMLMGIRWGGGMEAGDMASDVVGRWVMWLVHALMLVAAASVFFDPRWSPRALGPGMVWLPFYWLGALGVGYYTGYFLVVSGAGSERRRGWNRGPGGLGLKGAIMIVVMLAVGIGGVGYLGWVNGGRLRKDNGRWLGRLGDDVVKSLGESGGYLVGDDAVELLWVGAALGRAGIGERWILVNGRLMESKNYQEQMGRRYRGRWPAVRGLANYGEALNGVVVADWFKDLARSNVVYYLHGGVGALYEEVWGRPRGLVERIEVRGMKLEEKWGMSEGDVEWNRRYWAEVGGRLGAGAQKGRERKYVGGMYGRAMTRWGVALQRLGRWDEAGSCFARARELNPDSFVAKINGDFNRRWRDGQVGELDLEGRLERPEARRFDQLLWQDGPLDEPRWNYRLGLVCAQGSLYRQALDQFGRVLELAPTNQAAGRWRENMVAMVYFGRGEIEEAQRRVLRLKEQWPREDSVLETLTQLYLLTGRLTNALEAVEEQLAVGPDNVRALLNKGALCIHLRRYEAAVGPLDRLLNLQPEHTAALMNRAIALLQLGRLEAAERDYEALREQMPKYHAVYFGLGEVAYRRKQMGVALGHYQKYLRYAKPGTAEYTQVAQRVKELEAVGGK